LRIEYEWIFDVWKEYDKHGNLLHYKRDDYEEWLEYDKYDNLIYYKNSEGYEKWRKSDTLARFIKQIQKNIKIKINKYRN